MGKYAPSTEMDQGLIWITNSNYECVCSGSPTTFVDAYTNLMLARTTMTAGSATGSYAISASTVGEKLVISAATGVSITNSGTALTIALVNTSSSTLCYTTSCVSQALVAGGTVDIPSWSINIQPPV